jgi:hypothetical protein
METFKSFLIKEEVQWTKSLFDHLFTLEYSQIKNEQLLTRAILKAERTNPEVINYRYLIPDEDRRYQLSLVPSMIERVVGSVVTYGIHASSAENLEKLIKIQKKKAKQISVYTTDEEGRLASGVWGGGGVYSILRGNVYAGASMDIMSIVDKQGRRLVDLGPDTELAHSYDYKGVMRSPEYKSMWEDLKKFRNSLTKKLLAVGKKSIPVESYVDRAIDTPNVPPNVKRDFIKKYIDGTEKILKKHSKVFASMYINWAKKQSKSWNFVADEYDELVMGNFEIVKVYVDDEYYDEFVNWFAKIPDEDRFEDGFEEPSWDEVQKKAGFPFPVEFISGDMAYRLLPNFLEGFKK